MFRKFLLGAGIVLAFAAPAAAQNTTCSDRPSGDSSNACANTRFVQNAAGAGTVQPVNVVSLGAKCDWNGTTGTDDHVIIQSALNTYRNVLIPSQCYIGTSTLTFGNLAFATITGINSEWSALIQASTTAPTISVVATIPGLKISHLGVTKPSSVTALAGAIGIKYNGFNDVPVIEDVEVQKHYNGLSLSSTGYGKLSNSFIHDNLSDGIIFQNPTILNDYQWNLDTVLSQSNLGWGIIVVASSNATFGPKSSQGTWTNAFTFNNSSGGIKFLGNATVRIQGIRLNSPFLGSDIGPELVLDTFNTSIGSHIITNPYLEFNTSGPCLQITVNNSGGVSIVNPAFSTCFTAGLVNVSNNIFITGGFITAAGTFSVVNSGTLELVHVDLNGSVSGPLSNSGTYIGHLNTPASANTPFTVPEGGTGLAAGTSGGVLCFTAATTIASSVAMTANSIMAGAGAGACPTPIASVANSVLVTNGSGVPTFSTTLPAGLGVRTALTTNTTFNVATTGVDSNNCTSGAPCLTIQRAYDNLANFYDLQGFTATIQVANGTYTAGLITAKCVLGQNGPGGVQILGNATPSNVLINVTNSDAFGLGETSFGSGTQGCTQITIGGMKLQTTTGGNAVNVSGGGVGITVGTPGFPIDFGATFQDHMISNHSAWIIAGTNNLVSGGALIHVAALSNAVTALHNTTETFSNAPVFTYYAYADINASVYVDAMTFAGTVGSVTGTRYLAQNGGVIYALSASATYLPGNSTGVTQSKGNYVSNVVSQWSLTSDVINILPKANGGCATAGGGTWTPTLSFGGASVGITYGTRVGNYTQCGDVLTATANIVLTSKGSSTGGMVLSGLPVSCTASIGAVTVSFYASMSSMSAPTGAAVSTTINLYNATATGSLPLADTNFTNTTNLNLTAVCNLN